MRSNKTEIVVCMFSHVFVTLSEDMSLLSRISKLFELTGYRVCIPRMQLALFYLFHLFSN